jgi:hypothetical protein
LSEGNLPIRAGGCLNGEDEATVDGHQDESSRAMIGRSCNGEREMKVHVTFSFLPQRRAQALSPPQNRDDPGAKNAGPKRSQAAG